MGNLMGNFAMSAWHQQDATRLALQGTPPMVLMISPLHSTQHQPADSCRPRRRCTLCVSSFALAAGCERAGHVPLSGAMPVQHPGAAAILSAVPPSQQSACPAL